jgi:hypothetical protein
MILDAILLALAGMSSTQNGGVAILPGMRIDQGDGTDSSHGCELWLPGNVDYTIIEYEDVKDYKGELFPYTITPMIALTLFSDRLFSGSTADALHISTARLFIVEAKPKPANDNEEDLYLFSDIPEAVSQAIGLLKSARYVSTHLVAYFI